MASPWAKQPMSWEDYESGRSPRQGSIDSLGSHVQFDTSSTPPGGSHQLELPHGGHDSNRQATSLRHRTSRSSISMKINSLAQAGGPNSFENFARSWSRAAVFSEFESQRPAYVTSGDEEDSIGSKAWGHSSAPPEARSLLRQQLESQGTSPENAVVEDGPSDDRKDAESEASGLVSHSPARLGASFPDRTARLSSPFGSNLGGVYGSFSTHRPGSRTRASMQDVDEETAYLEPKASIDEHEPFLVKVVEQKDGKTIQVVVGQSTLPQTVFNSVNVLIGIGLLSLPLALKQSGWLIGMGVLFLAAVTTRHTALLLAKCLDLDQSLVTFSDIAWKAFGPRARFAVGFLFSLELLGACIALVILFADSLNALIPGFGVTEWKILCGVMLIPLSLVPLRYLSITSVLGILCCLGILILTIVDGATKSHRPGSLRETALTTAFPPRWSDVPLSIGLLMAPWGGHGVFPNIYRDMRHPARYSKAVNVTYAYTYLIDLAITVTGYLMFGQHVLDEVTSSVLMTRGYPHSISICIVVFIAIIPITKVPLNARPIYVIIEGLFGLNAPKPLIGASRSARALTSALIRAVVLIVIVLLAIIVPSFDTIMGLLGSALAFGICIILPVAFHLKLFSKELGVLDKALHWFLIVFCSISAVVATVWILLPKHVRRAIDR